MCLFVFINTASPLTTQPTESIQLFPQPEAAEAKPFPQQEPLPFPQQVPLQPLQVPLVLPLQVQVQVQIQEQVPISHPGLQQRVSVSI